MATLATRAMELAAIGAAFWLAGCGRHTALGTFYGGVELDDVRVTLP